MRTEFVYSIIAMGAIPVVVNAADVPGISGEALVSVDGSKVSIEVGELVKGSYTFKASLTSKVYGVKVTIAGTEVTADIDPGNPTNVSVDFELTEKTNVVLEFESTDVGVSGATFTVANAVVSLNFDFAGKKALLAANAEALADHISGNYNYAAKQEDVDAANALKTKAEGIEESYDDYMKFELYATKSTIQKEIDALDEAAANKEAVYQNDQAYSRVNAAITDIKGKYNTAVANLEATLVDAAEYLLNDAKDELNTEINVKITEATQASYASHNAGTAVADEATNMGKIPSEDTLNDIVADWTGQANDNKNAYSGLQGTVKDLQDGLDAIVPEEAIASQFATEKAEAQAAIDAVNGSVEDVYNSADQLTLGDDDNFKAAVNAAQGKINTLADKVTTANAEYNAWQEALTTIGGLQTNLNTAKETVDAKKSADGQYEAKDYYADYVDGVQGEIDGYTAGANKAYNEDHNAVEYNDNLDVSDTQGKIEAYQANAIAAVDKYDELQVAIGTYENELEAARTVAKQIGPKVYTDPNYDYETKFDLIQKDINAIKKAITAAQEKVGAEHWTEMLAIDKKEGIPAAIEDLLSQVQADQNQYDADFLAKGMTELEGKIEEFQAKDENVLGNDVAKFQNVENDINVAYTAVKNALEDINAQSETVDYTNKVGTTINDWIEGEVKHGGAPGRTCEVDGLTFVEQRGNSDQSGTVLVQTVEVPNGKYTVKLYAFAGQGGTVDSKEFVHVFANGKTAPVKVTSESAKNVYTIENVEVTDGTLYMGLAKDKGGTQWHGIQIESLEANTASLIQGWGAEVDDLNTQQDALETAANDVAAKVAANKKAKSDLEEAIGDNGAEPKTGMWKDIDDFKTLYKIGSDESTLGNRGKAEGAVTKQVAALETALTALQGDNVIDPLAVEEVNITAKVDRTWGGIGTAAQNVCPYVGVDTDPVTLDVPMREKYNASSCAETGVIISQTLNVDNGIYDVALYANANHANGVDNNHAITGDATDVAFVFANGKEAAITAKNQNKNAANGEFTLSNVIVSDGKLTIGILKKKQGTNWHTIQIKSVKYSENNENALYNNADDEKPGLNNRFTALNTEMNALKDAAPDIKAAVDANKDANTAATGAVTDLQTTELNTLKSLKNVTNASAVSDDETAKKADPENFKVFETGLDADKSYTAKKQAIDDDIQAMSDAIAASNAAETLATEWKDNSITVGEGDNKKTYSIAALTKAINDLKTEAVAESDNWEAYHALQESYMSKLLPDSIFTKKSGELLVDMTPDEIKELVGEGAYNHYTGLKADYITGKATILTNMQKDLTDRKSVSTKDAFVEEINNLIALVKVVQTDGVANYKKYLEQKKAYQDTQTLWNDTYTEIAATDHSSKVQEWLDELDAIQVTLTAATNAVETNYPLGKSVAEAKDFVAIQNDINDVKARQSEAYNAQIAEDNKAAHEKFMGNETTKGAIQYATEAYQTAVQERAQYSSTNPDIKDAVDAAAATLDDAIFFAPTKIADLTQKENDAYAAVVSPEIFDVNPFIAKFEDEKLVDGARWVETTIYDALNDFKATVKGALDDFWTGDNYRPAYIGKVNAAKNDISGYSADAQKKAFEDVENLIADGDAAVEAMDLGALEEVIDALKDIDAMLTNDKDAAANKDLTPLFSDVETKYAAVKEYIEGVTNDIPAKAEQLEILEAAYDDGEASEEDVAYAKTLDKDFENHNTIKGILDNFLTTADNCQTTVKNAVDADDANTAAYEDIIKALEPVEAKLAEAEAEAAPYKYPYSFATVEGNIKQDRADANAYKDAGSAVANKGTLLGKIDTHNNAIDAALTNAFGVEKDGLAADITELKNQFNIYVGNHGLDDKATAFNNDINTLQKAREDAAIVDLDDPADGIDYKDILAATRTMVQLQEATAAEQTELLKANGDDANQKVLDDFQAQLQGLSDQVNITGLNEWVGEQEVDGKTINSWLEEINGQIADVNAAIEADKDNIAFYKDQYQAQITAIAKVVADVTAVIAEKQDQFDANAEAYTELTGIINNLQKAIDEAKAKVGEYKYASTTYISLIEQYDEEGNLIGGAQFDLDEIKADVDAANDVKEAQNYHLNTLGIEVAIQNYLDNSANRELIMQKDYLKQLLIDAFDNQYVAQTYSKALWDVLTEEREDISGDITELWEAIYTANQVYEGSFDVETDDYTNIWGLGKYYFTHDENGDRVSKPRTSDDEYAARMAEVKLIEDRINSLGEAVENLQLLGDANEDNKVNVLDYQKVLNMILDPTLQPLYDPENPVAKRQTDEELFANIDINQSEVIEVGDLTAIVNYILNENWQGYAAARSFNRDNSESLSLDYSSVNSDVQRIAVNLENASNYTAFQMDVVLPDGMKIVGTSLSSRAAESHKLYSRTQLDGSIRILASSVKGDTFSGNDGAVLYIDVEGANASSVEILNILFSDVNANTREFKLGNKVTGINAVGALEALKQKIYDLGGRVMNGMKKGINIIRNADGSTQKVAK